MLFALKVGLVATAVLLASLAARRFGHRVAGTLAGMPVIAAPVTAFLLADQGAAPVREIALATLVCLPAAVVHITVFARVASFAHWPACLGAAFAAFFASGTFLIALHLPAPAVCLLAALAPAAGWVAMPQRAHVAVAVRIPAGELVLRILAAAAMASALIGGAGVLPASISGLLLAVPIAGSVLPSFTLPLHGAAATVSLLAGFTQGLHGFVAFFVVLYAALPAAGAGPAFGLALATSLATGLCIQNARRLYARAAGLGG